jgi:phosphomannomutase
MEDLIISVSGARGIVGAGFRPDVLARFAAAFGAFVGGQTVVIGRDTRTSGEMARHAIISGLMATGCHVIDVGVCPTPTVLLMAKNLKAQGALTITASHNPVDWNGIEFAAESGRLLNANERARLMQIYESESLTPLCLPLERGDKGGWAAWDAQGKLELIDTAVEQHIQAVLNCDWAIDPDEIRARALKVVIDAGNGAGSVISPRLLRELGCEVIELNCVPDGRFPRASEPTPDALDQLCGVVKSVGADVGLAHDGDADRLVLVSERGVPLSSEYTYALAADFLLRRRKGDIVATVSTSRMLDDVAERHNVALHRTPVGVGFVVEKMREINAVIGGEGTGGVVYPELQYTTDGVASIAVIVQLLASSAHSTISDRVASLPSYEMCKKKLEAPSQEIADAVIQLAIQAFSSDSLDLTDGVKRVWKDRWVNIRKSGTEPVIRVFSEAQTAEQAEELCDSTLAALRRLIEMKGSAE